MRAWPSRTSVFATGDTAVPLATETVVATLNGVNVDRPDARVDLVGFVQVTTGGVGSGIVPRIRRDSLTGTLVGEGNNINAVASNTVSVPLNVQDAPPEMAGGTYVLTLTVTGAAATAIQASLLALS